GMRDRDGQFVDADDRIVWRVAWLPDLTVGLSLLRGPVCVIEIPTVQRILRFRNGHWDVVPALGDGNIRGTAEPRISRYPEPLPVRIKDDPKIVEPVNRVAGCVLEVQTSREEERRPDVVAERVAVLVVVPHPLTVRDDHVRGRDSNLSIRGEPAFALERGLPTLRRGRGV